MWTGSQTVAERRGVGEVEVDELVDPHAGRGGRWRRVSIRLAAPRPPTICAPRSRPRAPLGQQLHRHRLAGRAGSRPAWSTRSSPRRPRSPPAAASRSVRPVRADLERADLRDRGADDAREGGVAAAEVDAGHPALLVGDRAEGDVDLRGRTRGGATGSSRPPRTRPRALVRWRRSTAMAPRGAGGRRRRSAASSPFGVTPEAEDHEVGGERRRRPSRSTRPGSKPATCGARGARRCPSPRIGLEEALGHVGVERAA